MVLYVHNNLDIFRNIYIYILDICIVISFNLCGLINDDNTYIYVYIYTGFYTKGRLLVKSNLICPTDKFSWQPGCPVLNITI